MSSSMSVSPVLVLFDGEIMESTTQNEKRRSRRHPTKGDRKRLFLLAFISMVRKRGLEPRRPKALPPQDSASTNFATSASLYRCLLREG